MTIEFLVLVVFTALLSLGTIRTLARLVEYANARRPIPVLLWRDVVGQAGLALPFLLIAISRALGLGPVLAKMDWWILLTSVPAIISVATYAYYEYFVIDKYAKDVASAGRDRRDPLLRRRYDMLLSAIKDQGKQISQQAGQISAQAGQILEQGEQRKVDIEVQLVRTEQIADLAANVAAVGADTHDKVEDIHDAVVEEPKRNGRA